MIIIFCYFSGVGGFRKLRSVAWVFRGYTKRWSTQACDCRRQREFRPVTTLNLPPSLPPHSQRSAPDLTCVALPYLVLAVFNSSVLTHTCVFWHSTHFCTFHSCTQIVSRCTYLRRSVSFCFRFEQFHFESLT